MEWISVKERLPPLSKFVVVWSSEGYWCEGARENYIVSSDCYWHDPEWMPIHDVTHWLEVTEPKESDAVPAV